jgi:hypothetical protein
MMLVTKYQISAINSYWEKCDEKYLGQTDRQTDRGKTVYPPPPSGSGGIINCKLDTNLYLIGEGNTVNPVYKGHSREPENVPFISSCPLYTC